MDITPKVTGRQSLIAHILPLATPQHSYLAGNLSMTSPYDYMTSHWSLFSSGTDLDATENLYQLLRRFEISPSEHIVYGEFRRFMCTQNCNSMQPFCFHAGRYIGNYDAVSDYLSGKGIQ